MSTTNKYAIHSDFEKVPVINIKFSRPVIGLLNLLLKATRLRKKTTPGVTTTRYTIKGDSGHAIKLIVAVPDDIQPDAPALVYYHGGAFAMTYSSMHLENAERYAKEAGCISVFVCYRLAMKNPFPASFDDAYAAVNWLVENAGKLGVDTTRIAVGGDSAGGALAAGVAQKCRDTGLVKLCGQLLIYPVMDHRCNTPSAIEFVDTPLFNAVSNQRMWQMYLKGSSTESAPPYAAPGLGSAENLPPAYIETAEFDPLRDEGLNFAKALQACGNAPTMNETLGTIHGYDGTAHNKTAIASMQKRIDFLRLVFN